MTRAELLRYWLPAILWTAVILVLSGGSGASTHTAEILQWLLHHTVGPLRPQQFDLLHFLVRKTGHVIGYAALGALDFRAVRGAGTGWKASWSAVAIILAALVASVDELHQSFLTSRTGTTIDVALDMAAASVAQLPWVLSSKR